MKQSRFEAADVNDVFALCKDVYVVGDRTIWREIYSTVKGNNHSCIFKQYERPDTYYLSKNYVVGIEYFQFDSSQIKERMGSSLQFELRQHEKNNLEKDNAVYEVTTNISYDFYKESLMAAFKKHVKSIPSYIKNLKKDFPSKKIYLAFCIADCTLGGNTIFAKGECHALSPIWVKEFLQELLKVPDLNYVILNYAYSVFRETLILENDNDYIKAFMEMRENLDIQGFYEHKIRTTL